MFSAYALRVIMFGPQASPVVKAHITWQIGPATYVSTSRSFAWRETHSASSPASHSRILGSSPSIHLPSATASSTELVTNADARVIRSRKTTVRNPPESAAARAPRYSESDKDPSVGASGT